MKTLRLALVLASLATAAQAQIVETPIAGDPVAIDTGKVAGKTLASGVRAYFGVPFAAPPVRENRWREPQAVAPWKGVWNADRKPPECIQVLRPHNINHYFGEEATSEDCLYLNIWAPPGAAKKAPVVVWFYGGGFTIGSSSMANYDGEVLAKKGVVYIAVNYRVGAMGFMAHPELTAESGHGASGNWGLLDQVAALQWIKRNAAAFGGDPDNVTIMGQSAGSSSVVFLQTSPLAKGLFHKAVTMSGAPSLIAPMPSRDEAEQAGLKFQEGLKAASLAEMRFAPADKVLALQADCQLGCAGAIRVGPIQDGYFLQKSPGEVFAAGQQNDVPMLIGFTRDESSSPFIGAKTVAAYQAMARDMFGEKGANYLAAYPVKTDADIAAAGAMAAREGGMQQGMRNLARAQTATGKAPVYMYMFARKHPYVADPKLADQDPKTIGAYHTSDVPYWLGNLDIYNWRWPTRDWTTADRALTDTMSGAIVSLARTGSPGAAWPKYNPKAEALTELGDRTGSMAMATGRLDFWTTVAPQPALGAAAPGRPRD